jgi:hypothetical protein
MTALKGMALGTMPDRGNRDPVVNRRMTMIKKLEHQRAKALDDDYVRVEKRFTGKGEERRVVERQKNVRPWFRTDARGRYFLSLFVGARPIALDDKGSNAVVVKDRDELVKTMDALAEVLASGSLDAAISKVEVRAFGAKKKKDLGKTFATTKGKAAKTTVATQRRQARMHLRAADAPPFFFSSKYVAPSAPLLFFSEEGTPMGPVRPLEISVRKKGRRAL